MAHALTFKTPWGWMAVTASDKGLTAVDLSTRRRRTASEPHQTRDGTTAFLIEAQT